MKKTFVRMVLSMLFLFTCGALSAVGDGSPRPPICPPGAVCT